MLYRGGQTRLLSTWLRPNGLTFYYALTRSFFNDGLWQICGYKLPIHIYILYTNPTNKTVCLLFLYSKTNCRAHTHTYTQRTKRNAFSGRIIIIIVKKAAVRKRPISEVKNQV